MLNQGGAGCVVKVYYTSSLCWQHKKQAGVKQSAEQLCWSPALNMASCRLAEPATSQVVEAGAADKAQLQSPSAVDAAT